MKTLFPLVLVCLVGHWLNAQNINSDVVSPHPMAQKELLYQHLSPEKWKAKHLIKTTEIEVAYRLDSLIAFNYMGESDSVFSAKKLYNYNAQGHFVEQTDLGWFNNTWRGSSRREMAYDAQDRMSNDLYAFWDDASNGWLPNVRYDYIYHLNTELIQTFVQWKWDATAQNLLQDEKREYQYNDNNDLIETITYAPDLVNGNWHLDDKTVRTYDENNVLIQLIEQDWHATNQEWLNKYKVIYTNNANGQEVERISSVWENGQWIEGLKQTTSYDANGFANGLRSYNKVGNDWIAVWKFDMENDAMGRLLNETLYYWNVSAWDPNYQTSYAYNSEGQIVEQQQLTWDMASNDWIPFNKETTIYQNNDIAPIRKSQYLWANNVWDLDERDFYFYTEYLDTTVVDSAVVSSLNELETMNSLQVYPNPANNIVNIPIGEKAFIYDLNGQMVLMADLLRNSQVNVGDLPKGIYWVQIQSNTTKKRYQQKLIIM